MENTFKIKIVSRPVMPRSNEYLQSIYTVVRIWTNLEMSQSVQEDVRTGSMQMLHRGLSGAWALMGFGIHSPETNPRGILKW